MIPLGGQRGWDGIIEQLYIFNAKIHKYTKLCHILVIVCEGNSFSDPITPVLDWIPLIGYPIKLIFEAKTMVLFLCKNKTFS